MAPQKRENNTKKREKNLKNQKSFLTNFLTIEFILRCKYQILKEIREQHHQKEITTIKRQKTRKNLKF
jgi:hypothetical protein